MYYVKFRNISGKPQRVQESHGAIIVQPNHVFWGDIEASLGSPSFQRIKEILPTARYDFSSWTREHLIKALLRMGVNFNNYSTSTGQLIDIIRAEYENQRQYLKEHEKELVDDFYKDRGGVQTPPESNPATNPLHIPLDALKEETIRQKEEILAKKQLTVIHNDAGIESNTYLGDHVVDKKQKTEKEFLEENKKVVADTMDDIRKRRKEEAVKKFDMRKLNIDMLLVFLDKYTTEDWTAFDYTDNKWLAFDKIKELGKAGTVENYENLLEVEYNEYTERTKVAPKKWTGATKTDLLVILEAMGSEVTLEHEGMEKKQLMSLVKAYYEVFKRNGLPIDGRRLFYTYEDKKAGDKASK